MDTTDSAVSGGSRKHRHHRYSPKHSKYHSSSYLRNPPPGYPFVYPTVLPGYVIDRSAFYAGVSFQEPAVYARPGIYETPVLYGSMYYVVDNNSKKQTSFVRVYIANVIGTERKVLLWKHKDKDLWSHFDVNAYVADSEKKLYENKECAQTFIQDIEKKELIDLQKPGESDKDKQDFHMLTKYSKAVSWPTKIKTTTPSGEVEKSTGIRWFSKDEIETGVVGFTVDDYTKAVVDVLFNPDIKID